MKKVSVIVPVYNVEQYLERCVESIRNQSYKNLEIILVDDGSPDNCGKMCDEFAEIDNRIKVIHQENSGLSAARNSGLKIATGEYISFVDSDDWISPQMIDIMAGAMDRHNADVVACDFVHEYKETGKFKEIKDFNEIILQKSDLFKTTADTEHFAGYACNKLYRREKIGNLEFDEGLFSCEDIDFVSQFVTKCEIGVYLPVALYHYYHHSASMTGEINYSYRKIDVINVYERLIDRYKENCPQLLSKIYCNYLKININVKGRYLRSKINQPDVLERLNDNIENTYGIVMMDKNINLATKINILISKKFPKQLLRLKQMILRIKFKG